MTGRPTHQGWDITTKSTASYLGTQSYVDFTSVALCPQPDSITTVKKNANKQNNMYKYHDKITSIEIDSVNYKLGKLFFGCNIPFSIVESVHFKGFCQALRPAYKPPSRKVLSSRLLNEVHNNICSSLRFRSDSVLLIDGWKNEAANTKNVASLLHSATGEAVFLESFDLTGIRETGEELADIIEQCLKLALEKYQTHIYAVVTDNAANMMKMGRLTTIWHLTCNSHTANLLAKDVVSKAITGQVKTVLKAFHGPDVEKELLAKGGRRIMMPCDTRWCTYRDSFRNLQSNIPAMKNVLASSEHKFDGERHRYLFDSNFIKNLSNSIDLFDPVCELINICQQIKTSIADAAELWLNLPSKIPSGFESFNNYIAKRQKYALNEYSLTANYLHPIYQKHNKMSPEQKDIVENLILNSTDIGTNGLNSSIRGT